MSLNHILRSLDTLYSRRPQVEVLEDRWCPSCTVFREGTTLFIRGDDAANPIEIRDHGFERGVSVRCDEGVPQTVPGIARIELSTLGGDDRVTHLLGGPDTTPADFRFDLGADHDTLAIEWINPEDGAPPRVAGRPVVFDGSTGTGNDRVTATFVNPPDGDFVFRANLGTGDNGYILCWQDPESYHGPQPPRRMAFDVIGGSGRDDVTAMFVTPRDPQLDFRADLGAGANTLTATYVPPDESDRDTPPGRVRLEGIGGNEMDRFNVFVGDPSNGVSVLNAELEVRLDGGGADDVESVVVHKTEMFGALTLQMEGGPGDDIESVLFEDSAESPAPLHGPVNVSMATGAGSDSGSVTINSGRLLGQVSVHIDTAGGDDRAAMTLRDSHDFNGTMDVHLDTGAGDDRASLLIERCLRFGPLLNFSLDSGAGNDSNTVMISDSDGFEGFLNVGVAAGSGIDDTATIFAFNPQPDPPGEPLNVTVQIDAGPGSDRTRAALDLGGKRNARLRVGLLGAGGEDDVGLELSGIGNLDAVDARVDTGAGNDTFAAVFQEGPVPESPDGECLVSLDVRTGVGDDHAGVTLTDIVADMQAGIDLGAGTDTFQARFAIPDGGGAEGPSIQQLDPGNRVGLEVLGREGDDRFGLTVGDRAGPVPHILNSDVTAHFDGGAGSDSAILVIINVAVNGTLSATADLDDGDDRASLETTNAVLNGSTSLSLVLGAGNDVMGWQNHDTHVTGALVVDVHGSSGDDSIDIGLRPRVVDSDSEYALRVFGEDGDDQIDVRIDADPDGRGRIVAELFGGAGDDELGLAVFGVDDPLFDGLVDGGAGFDVARGTRNVLFRNVEEVFLIE